MQISLKKKDNKIFIIDRSSCIYNEQKILIKVLKFSCSIKVLQKYKPNNKMDVI